MSDRRNTSTRYKKNMATHTWSAEHALDRAALWRLVAVSLRYPDRRGAAELRNRTMWERALDAAQSFDGPQVHAVLLKARDALMNAVAEDLETAYGRCFGHTVRGPVPPYESEWGKSDGLLQPHRIADLAAFYRAHGLVLSPGAERADHVSVQAEFLHFLACKEARALISGERDLADSCEESTAKILACHLGQFAPAFSRRLEATDGAGPYAQFARILRDLVEVECRSREIATGDDALPLRTVSFADDAACVSCALRANEAGLADSDHGEN